MASTGALTRAIRRLADRVADQPLCFHYLRKLPEANYRETRRRLREMDRRLGRPRVLDLGCGTGEFASLFEPARYLGLDVHPGYLRFARRRHPDHRFECADAARWPGDGTPFGMVLMNGVLHHHDDESAGALLDAAMRRLADDGRLVLIEDTRMPGAGPGTRLVHWLDHGDHIRSADDWRRLVSRHALIEQAESYRSGLCPYRLMLCRRS